MSIELDRNLGLPRSDMNWSSSISANFFKISTPWSDDSWKVDIFNGHLVDNAAQQVIWDQKCQFLLFPQGIFLLKKIEKK